MIIEDWKNLPKRRKVTRICDKCEKVHIIGVDNLRKYNNEKYCRSCQRKLNGWVMSEETKTKLSKGKKGVKTGPRSEEYVEKHLKGENNPFYGKHHKQESKDRATETRRNNPNYRENFEKGLKKRDLRGAKNGMFGKPPAKPKRSKLWYKNICFRSSWELKFAQFLDKENELWEYENITLKLETGEGYTPDFIVGNIILEIKGFYWNDDSRFERAKKLYPEYKFILINQQDLKNMGIL